MTADTLKRLGTAPNNESYIINILRFIGVIDETGAKTSEASATFSKHEDAEFQAAFSQLIEAAYKGSFELHGPNAWTLPSDKLISYFKGADHTGAIVGQRQATTFQTLAKLSGHGEPVTAPKPSAAPAKKTKDATPKKEKQRETSPGTPVVVGSTPDSTRNGVGLTVRIEINLPATGDQDTYDKIFKSIRDNLLNG